MRKISNIFDENLAFIVARVEGLAITCLLAWSWQSVANS